MKKFLLAVSFALCVMSWGHAADDKEKQERFVQVSGEGEVKVEPDEVLISFQIESFGKDLKEVQAESARKNAAVLEALKKHNIPAKDIQTGYARISPRYDFPNGKRKFREFSAVKNTSLKLRDIATYGAVLNSLMDAGVESIGGVQFSSSKLKQMEAEARKSAAADAKTKAEALAGPLGARVGRPMTITENTYGGPIVQNMRGAYMAKGMAMAAEAMPEDSVAAGELTIKTQVEVRFELISL